MAEWSSDIIKLACSSRVAILGKRTSSTRIFIHCLKQSWIQHAFKSNLCQKVIHLHTIKHTKDFWLLVKLTVSVNKTDLILRNVKMSETLHQQNGPQLMCSQLPQWLQCVHDCPSDCNVFMIAPVTVVCSWLPQWLQSVHDCPSNCNMFTTAPVTAMCSQLPQWLQCVHDYPSD